MQNVADAAHELKVIIFNKSDFAFAEHHAKLVGPDCKLYLQPEWSKSKGNDAAYCGLCNE
jgi:7-carboxy-7-deazaguanine synthase